MAIKVLLTTAFAIVAIGGSMVVGKHIIDQIPVKKLSTPKEPKNIKELLTSKGYKLLNPEEDRDNTKWIELVKRYIENKDSITKIEGLTFEGTTVKANEKDIETLKNKCKELLKKPITNSQNFELWKKNTIDWCTDKIADSSKVINIG